MVEDIVYHPGDSLVAPPGPVDTLLVPMQASWLKTSEAIAFVSSVTARQAVGIHYGQLSAHGVGATTRWLTRTRRIPYLTSPPGTPSSRSPWTTTRRWAGAGLSGGNQLIADHSDRFTYGWYGSPAERGRIREQALETFLADYAHPARYVAGSLPDLPLATRSVELGLCSHLLFTWAEVFDEARHPAALVELARVAAEVRVFPVVLQGSGRPVSFLGSLRTRLDEEFGITSSWSRCPTSSSGAPIRCCACAEHDVTPARHRLCSVLMSSARTGGCPLTGNTALG